LVAGCGRPWHTPICKAMAMPEAYRPPLQARKRLQRVFGRALREGDFRDFGGEWVLERDLDIVSLVE
jgi:hypothetical protein